MQLVIKQGQTEIFPGHIHTQKKKQIAKENLLHNSIQFGNAKISCSLNGNIYTNCLPPQPSL